MLLFILCNGEEIEIEQQSFQNTNLFTALVVICQETLSAQIFKKIQINDEAWENEAVKKKISSVSPGLV